jgi:hypothetical protein
MPEPTIRLGVMEPRDAVAVFQQRGQLETTYAWQDLWHHEHARAFTVSRLANVQLLEQMRAEIDSAIKNGTRFDEFAKAMRPRLEAAGWWGKREVIESSTGEIHTTTFDPQRLRLIYDTNTRQSYAAGRWQRAERSAHRFPFLLYRTAQDERVRASHRRWNNLALPIGHTFWDAHYPPNGWRCRCMAFPVDQRDIDRRRAAGDDIRTEAPPDDLVEFVNKRTGQVTQVPRGIDPGFDYNPGKVNQAERAGRQLAEVLGGAAPDVARSVIGQTMRSDPWRRFVEQPLPGEVQPVAIVPQRPALTTPKMREALPVVTVTGEVATAVRTAEKALRPQDFSLVQRALDGGRLRAEADRVTAVLQTGSGSARLYTVVELQLVEGAGWVLVELQQLTAAEVSAVPALAWSMDETP